MRIIISVLEFVGGITLLAGRVLSFVIRGKLNAALVLRQMVLLGINSIPITMLVLAFGGAVFSNAMAGEMYRRGAGALVGGMLLMMLLREIVPLFCGTVLAGRIGASITSEIGTMEISEQIDALRALSTDPDWYLTAPRVVANVLMTPVIAVFSGYSAWYAGYLMAHLKTGMQYASFVSSVRMWVDGKDIVQCAVKCIAIGATIALVACYYGFRAKGGASGVGKAVTMSVVINILIIYILDLLLTLMLEWLKRF
jgi:phospholipid/cholesterol/gamma-HCH transport system permease protein